MNRIRVGAGSGYWGDALEPALELIEKGNVDYVGFDHLAELTLAILQRIKAKHPNKGYIPDIVPWMKACLPLAMKHNVKMISNGGGANPEAAAEQVAQVAKELEIEGLKIGVVVGDDLLDRIDELRSKGIKFRNTDTGEEDLDRVKDRIVAANAYIGADSVIDALREGTQVVIGGRLSDNALYVGPWMYEFEWKFGETSWDKIGAAVTAGHIIECGAPASGGITNQWRDVPEPWKTGYPIAEMNENGECIICKSEGSGGLINTLSVSEHLVYEVHDPSNYMMPDGIADFTSLKLEEIGKDRVKVSGMKGKKRPDDLKVCIGYKDGFIGEAHIFFPWPDAFEKAQWAEKWIREKLNLIGAEFEELRIDYFGINVLGGKNVPFPPPYAKDLYECGLRVVGKTKTYEEADVIRREGSHLWSSGPIGSSFGVPFSPRPIISLWPTLVPREEVPTTVIIKEVK